MKPLILLITLFSLLVPLSAGAQGPLLAQAPILPAAPGPHPDLDALLQRFWHDYYGVEGKQGFTMSQVRVGRIDLNDDDQLELILMIDAPGWKADAGKPFVIATWIDGEWVAIGWGWGDEDNVFSLTETVRGWHSLETGAYIMRWTGTQYERVAK